MTTNNTLKLLVAASALAAFLNHASAQTVISSGHADIGIAYEDNAWDLHVHVHDGDAEFDPSEVIFEIGTAAKTTVPLNPSYSFLGTAGSDIWILPKNENVNLPFLGLGTEELTASDWIGNITLRLKAVSGPGDFSLYDVDSFGSPTVYFNSSATTGGGITGDDNVSLIPGSHAHYNWGFTAPGEYTVTLQAEGTHLIDGFTQSPEVSYSITVVPEPSTYALMGMGIASVLWQIRKRRTSL